MTVTTPRRPVTGDGGAPQTQIAPDLIVAWALQVELWDPGSDCLSVDAAERRGRRHPDRSPRGGVAGEDGTDDADRQRPQDG